MLKFTYLINFGLAGALIVPSVAQQLAGVEQLENSIASTDQAIAKATIKPIKTRNAASGTNTMVLNKGKRNPGHRASF